MSVLQTDRFSWHLPQASGAYLRSATYTSRRGGPFVHRRMVVNDVERTSKDGKPLTSGHHAFRCDSLYVSTQAPYINYQYVMSVQSESQTQIIPATLEERATRQPVGGFQSSRLTDPVSPVPQLSYYLTHQCVFPARGYPCPVSFYMSSTQLDTLPLP